MQGGLGGAGPRPERPVGDREVCSELLRVEAKLFYLDLKENVRGRYLKVAEKAHHQRERCTIIVPRVGITWFVALFDYFTTTPAELLVNKELPIESKVFYFEVGQNRRGRFLRISESGSGPWGRSSVVIPSGGPDSVAAWQLFHDSLARIEAVDNQLLVAQAAAEPPPLLPSRSSSGGSAEASSSGNGSGSPSRGSATAEMVAGPQTVVGPGPSQPELHVTEGGSTVLRYGHKRFFFNRGSNHKGAFLRVTEVVGSERISLIMAMEAVPFFIQALNACWEQHQQAAAQQQQGLG